MEGDSLIAGSHGSPAERKVIGRIGELTYPYMAKDWWVDPEDPDSEVLRGMLDPWLDVGA